MAWARNQSVTVLKWVVNQATLVASMTQARESCSHIVVPRRKKSCASAWLLARILGAMWQVDATRKDRVFKRTV